MSVEMDKTLEELEKFEEGSERFDSALVKRTLQLRKKPIKDLTAGDQRLLIGQGIGLKSLLPRAISIIEKDPFVEAEYYPGDLLFAILTVEPCFWLEHKDLYQSVYTLLEGLAESIRQICDATKNFKALETELIQQATRRQS